MYENIEFLLTIVGAATILFIIVIVCNQIRKVIGELIDDLRWIYKRKHRFDKPPMAKCYCKDCVYFVNNGEFKCIYGHINDHWHMLDSYFCYHAKPHNHDPENK